MLHKLGRLIRAMLAGLVLALLVYGFAQTLPLDLALLFAGDTLLYMEIATAVWLAAQVTRLRFALAYGRMIVRRSVRRARWRARRLSRHVRRLAASRKPPADPDGTFAYA